MRDENSKFRWKSYAAYNELSLSSFSTIKDEDFSSTSKNNAW